MARKKISEYRAKTLLANELGVIYQGISFTSSDSFDSLKKLDPTKTYVIKVDQGVKKRMQQGLLALNKQVSEIPDEIGRLQAKGYSHFLIEPFLPHEQVSEKYFSIERVREGFQVFFATKGGIDIEENQREIKKVIIPYNYSSSEKQSDESRSISSRLTPFVRTIIDDLSITEDILEKIFEAFEKYYFSFLEINPLVVEHDKTFFLDIASEVDSSADFFVHHAWTSQDFRTGEIGEKTEEEKAIDDLAKKSQASFMFTLLNPNGSVFMLLSGGGASIVLADEVYNVGFGKELANYGEYSGNPNAEEVHLYTKNLLSLLVASSAPKKVLVIGGGVANFTDIRITFRGLIKALDEAKEKLREQKIKVFVRRGGPNQEEGLKAMRDFLEKEQVLGAVSGPDMPLPEIVRLAIEEVRQ